MSKKNKTLVLVLLLAVVLLAAVPFLTLKDAEFGGSDDAGSVMVEEIHGEYEPWFTPVLEDFLGKEIPGEVESLLFCVCRAEKIRGETSSQTASGAAHPFPVSSKSRQ